MAVPAIGHPLLPEINLHLRAGGRFDTHRRHIGGSLCLANGSDGALHRAHARPRSPARPATAGPRPHCPPPRAEIAPARWPDPPRTGGAPTAGPAHRPPHPADTDGPYCARWPTPPRSPSRPTRDSSTPESRSPSRLRPPVPPHSEIPELPCSCSIRPSSGGVRISVARGSISLSLYRWLLLWLRCLRDGARRGGGVVLLARPHVAAFVAAEVIHVGLGARIHEQPPWFVTFRTALNGHRREA